MPLKACRDEALTWLRFARHPLPGGEGRITGVSCGGGISDRPFAGGGKRRRAPCVLSPRPGCARPITPRWGDHVVSCGAGISDRPFAGGGKRRRAPCVLSPSSGLRSADSPGMGGSLLFLVVPGSVTVPLREVGNGGGRRASFPLRPGCARPIPPEMGGITVVSWGAGISDPPLAGGSRERSDRGEGRNNGGRRWSSPLENHSGVYGLWPMNYTIVTSRV